MRPLKHKQLKSLLSALQDQQEYVFFDTSRSDSENNQSFLFLEPSRRLDFFTGEDPESFVAEMEQTLADGFYLAGWLSYEIGYLLEPPLKELLPISAKKGDLLASFGVFSEPLSFDHGTGQTSLPMDGSAVSLPEFKIDNLHFSQDKESYLDAICRIKEYIIAGDTY